MILTDIAHLIRLPNQSGTFLLMLPPMWALILASGGHPPFLLVAVFAAGAFLMRSAGVVLNDLADQSIDRQVERTRTRPLASGVVKRPVAMGVGVALLMMAAGLLAFLNPLAVALSPVAVLLAAAYPFSKRLVDIPQAVLGVAFGWGVVMAWAAVRNDLSQPVWLLFTATVFWAVAYDSIYALQDRTDDMRIGVKSSAILFGEWTWLAVGFCCLAMVACLAIAGSLVDLNPGFYLVLGAVAMFLLAQTVRLRGSVSPAGAFAMFKQHIWVGCAILGGFWIGFF